MFLHQNCQTYLSFQPKINQKNLIGHCRQLKDKGYQHQVITFAILELFYALLHL